VAVQLGVCLLMSNIIIASITTLTAVFIGALLAFELQNIREKRAEENRRRMAVNRCQRGLLLHREYQLAIKPHPLCYQISGVLSTLV